MFFALQVTSLAGITRRDHGCVRGSSEPAPVAQLSNFGADGLEFTVGFWIGDPEVGQGGLKSDLNLAILAALRAKHIDIPYPQRGVHQR